MERMNENLTHFLERHRGRLSIPEQIRISHEITQGVAFLHQLTPPMVHRDLNDKNVMFTFDGVAKIGDFGQSKLKQDLYLTSAQPGMLLYMPPEALDEKNCKYDESLDMFSLGVLMLEIGTQQQPMASYLGIGSTPEIKRRENDLQKMADVNPLKPFILLCLNNDQKQRPKAAVMCTVLSSLRNVRYFNIACVCLHMYQDQYWKVENMCTRIMFMISAMYIFITIASTVNNDVYKSCYGMWVCICTGSIYNSVVCRFLVYHICVHESAVDVLYEWYYFDITCGDVVVAQYVHTELYVYINIM